MLHHYRSVRCPKCDLEADRSSTDSSFILYGSPYRVCRKCGAAYFDPGYHELAIDAYNDNGVLIDFGGLFCALLTNGVAVLFLIERLKGNSNTWLPLICAFGFALVFDYRAVISIRNLIKAKEYHQEQIDGLEGRYGEMSDDLAESMERMSDRKYLDALRFRGVDVPEYFYKRISSREGSFTEPEGVVVLSPTLVKERTW